MTTLRRHFAIAATAVITLLPYLIDSADASLSPAAAIGTAGPWPQFLIARRRAGLAAGSNAPPRLSSTPYPRSLLFRGGGGDGDGDEEGGFDDEDREVDALRHFERARRRLTGYVDPYQELYHRKDDDSRSARGGDRRVDHRIEAKDSCPSRKCFSSSEDGNDENESQGYRRAEVRDGRHRIEGVADVDNERGGDNGLLRIPCSLVVVTDPSAYRDGGASNNDCDDGIPLLTYVDTGAQVTVLSSSAARRAGLLHLLDGRYAGRATGVGHARVLGRIPAGSCAFVLRTESPSPVSEEREIRLLCPQLTILDDSGLCTRGVDLLLGLDVLSEWGADICLGEGELRVRTPPFGDDDAKDEEDIVAIPFFGRKRSHSARNSRRRERSRRGVDLARNKASSPGRTTNPNLENRKDEDRTIRGFSVEDEGYTAEERAYSIGENKNEIDESSDFDDGERGSQDSSDECVDLAGM